MMYIKQCSFTPFQGSLPWILTAVPATQGGLTVLFQLNVCKCKVDGGDEFHSQFEAWTVTATDLHVSLPTAKRLCQLRNEN